MSFIWSSFQLKAVFRTFMMLGLSRLADAHRSRRIQVSQPQRSFLVVEDEALIRMMLVDMIETLGHVVVAEAGSVEDAVRVASDTAFDNAILDINLGGSKSTPVAEIFARKAVPFIFYSGYGEDGLPEDFRNRPMLRKPFQLDALDRAVQTVLEN
jgi:CheY-like chemotaxis protein